MTSQKTTPIEPVLFRLPSLLFLLALIVSSAPTASAQPSSAERGEKCPQGSARCNGKCLKRPGERAQCTQGGWQCPKDTVLCDNQCQKGPEGSTCSQGKLVCGNGQQNCTNKCINVDEANCSGCGKACPKFGICDAVAKQCKCQGVAKDCGGICTNTLNNPDQCGDCGKKCKDDEKCLGRLCVKKEKPDGAAGETPRTNERN